MLLQSCFDANDESSIIEEFDELMEQIKKTWGILGMNQTLHNLCFTWVLFHRFVATGQMDLELLSEADGQLAEVAKDAKATKDSEYSKILSSTLTSILGWAEKRLLAYHETFDRGNVETMEGIVSLGVAAAKILVEDISNEYRRRRRTEVNVARERIETYIRSSIRTAFAQIMEKADSSRRASKNQPNALPVLAILAKDVGSLAVNEKQVFSPIFKRWHPLPAGLAVATLHVCYGNELKQFISGITELTPDAVQVLRAADQLEKDLVQIAVEDSVDSDDGGKAIIREMPPYEAEGAIANLVKIWIKTRIDRLKEWVDRNLQQELWSPQANQEGYAPSAVEALRIINETLDAFFQLPIPMHPALLPEVIHGLDRCLQYYVTKAKSGCGSRNTFIPTMPALTRCTIGSKFQGFGKKKDKSPNSQKRNPQVATNGDSSFGIPQLCVRINTLQWILGEFDVLEKRIITLLRNSESAREEDFSNGLANKFELSPAACLEGIQILIIHNNNFTSFPSDFFSNMSNLQEVRIDYNPFPKWRVPDSLKDCVALQTFSAMSAGFFGGIPEFFGKDGPFPGLVYLGLCFNSFEGGLPNGFSGTSIENLLVNGQNSNSKLNGTLAVLQNMTSLKQIWVHGNSFTGPIPDLSNHDQLFDVSLRDNQLTGVVPPSLTALPALQVVNLTNNYLQGSPPKFKDGVRVDNDMVKGNNRFCRKEVGQPCSSLVIALLSVVEPFGYPLKLADSWQGNDPCANDQHWDGIVCSGGNISIISFQNMGLSGSISPSFASLTSVTRLLLANNGLTGTIPRELTSMPLLKELDVSNNRLYGQVPPFRGDVVVKTGGNPDIGKDKPQSPPGSDSGGKDKKKHSTGAIVGIVVGCVGLLGVGVLVFVVYGRKHKRAGKAPSPNVVVVHPRHSGDGNGVKISVAAASASASAVGGAGGTGGGFSPSSSVQNVEAGNMVISIQVLREVTNNFSEGNILGKGGFGTVYKGELHDGTKIAVKRMECEMGGEKGLSEFRSEIAVLTKVRHRHLVALLGHCLDGNERLLVYEYMPQGPLSKHLFDWKDEGLKPLEWKRRLSIALDVARGVEYLHGLAQQIFIHRDLKPSNILLGDDMRAKVSDFGLVRLAPEGQASFETRLAGTFGYLAPEYAVTGRVTTKVDVYSYGVILMEMITGRKAIDNSQPEENVHLVTWFRRMLLNKDSFRKHIDPTMDVDEEALESLRTIADLAGHCCAREPHQRPDMSHVVNVLAPLVEIWKPSEPDADDIYGIDLDISLPQALSKWQAVEGTSTLDLTSSSILTSAENTQSSIPPRSPGFADSFTSSDAR